MSSLIAFLPLRVAAPSSRFSRTVIVANTLLPLGVYFVPWWLHPVTHWNPLFWVHHGFLHLHLTPEQLEASGIRFPVTFDWEYAAVPIAEAAIYAWLMTRRVRRLAGQATD